METQYASKTHFSNLPNVISYRLNNYVCAVHSPKFINDCNHITEEISIYIGQEIFLAECTL